MFERFFKFFFNFGAFSFYFCFFYFIVLIIDNNFQSGNIKKKNNHKNFLYTTAKSPILIGRCRLIGYPSKAEVGGTRFIDCTYDIDDYSLTDRAMPDRPRGCDFNWVKMNCKQQALKCELHNPCRLTWLIIASSARASVDHTSPPLSLFGRSARFTVKTAPIKHGKILPAYTKKKKEKKRRVCQFVNNQRIERDGQVSRLERIQRFPFCFITTLST